MTCDKCDKSLDQIAGEPRIFGCKSAYHCPYCHIDYICDSSGKAGTKDGNTVYIWGPCCCMFWCDCTPNPMDKIKLALEEPVELGVFTKKLISLTRLAINRANNRPTTKELDDESARY